MRTAFTLVVLVAALTVVMVLLGDYQVGTIVTAALEPKSLATTGFIILAAFAMGELVKLVNIPALLGYIIAGLIFGPNFYSALHSWGLIETVPPPIVSLDAIKELNIVNVLAIGVLGMLGGGELVIKDIKRNIKTIAIVVGIVFAVAIPSSAVAVLWAARDSTTIVPFLQGLPVEHHYAAALLFGVFGVAMSPAATLAILQETRAKGPFTSLALGLVIVGDLALVAALLVTIAFTKLYIAPEGFTNALLIAELPTIAAEFGYAILLGVPIGVITIVFMRYVRQRSLFFTVAIIIVASHISSALHAETLLAFLTAGFIVQNFSKYGHEMVHALEKVSLPVFVLYFMTQAAILDLRSVAAYAALALILTLCRDVTLFLATSLGSRLAKTDETTRRYLWLTCFSLGSVDLILAQKVADSGLPWGAEFQTVIMACVVIHLLIGPPLLKLALDRAGESEGSRQQNKAEAEAFDRLPSVEPGVLSESFPHGRFEDPELQARVDALRELFLELYERHAVPLEQKMSALKASLLETENELEQQLDQVERVLLSDAFESDSARASAVASVHREYLNMIADNVATWERVSPEIVHSERINELITTIRNATDFDEVYRVRKESYLVEAEADDRTKQRALKALRKFQRSIVGVGFRHVPLGRLWRYYVELSVTRYLASAADASSSLNEQFWGGLDAHMRRSDELFERIADAVRDPSSATLPESSPVTHDEHDEGDDGTVDDASSSAELSPALRLLQHGRQEALAREEALNAQLDEVLATALERYTVALRETFANFVFAAERTGTTELLPWKHRPSTLFDRSRRAEVKIEQRLQREHNLVTAYHGWIVVDWQLMLFRHWLPDYKTSVAGMLDRAVGAPVLHQIDALTDLITALPPELQQQFGSLQQLREGIASGNTEAVEVDWASWVEQTLRPAIAHAQNDLQRIISLYDNEVVSRRLLDPLERRIGHFSEEIVLLNADRRGGSEPIQFREWFETQVVRTSWLRLGELKERGEAIVRTKVVRLEEVLQVVEFNLLTAQRANGPAGNDSLEVATGALERAVRMLHEMREAQTQRFGQLNTWIVDALEEIAEDAAVLFLDRNYSEIERRAARQSSFAERSENWLTSAAQSTLDAGRDLYRLILPAINEVTEDVRGVLLEHEEPVRHADIRERLYQEERIAEALPNIYRRLFTPMPLDIPDFYITRPEAERESLDAIQSWIDGDLSTVLVYGDRGIGKRTTTQHLLHHAPSLATLREKYQLHSVVLSEDLATEAELVQHLAEAMQITGVTTLEQLTRFLEMLEPSHVVVIENGEKLFTRTHEGIEVARRFFAMMNATSSTVLWIVLLGSPAVTFLDTAIGVFDYFTHAVHLGALSHDEVEQMIQRRHRVSGFRDRYVRERARISDWLAHPLATSAALGDPRADFFGNLHRLSAGNPMLALIYWLEASRLDPSDDHLILLETLPDDEPKLIESLTLTKQLILAALVQHSTLTARQLQEILRCDLAEVTMELDHLRRLGFVREVLGQRGNAYQLRFLADGLVTVSLRRMNMV